MDKALNESLPIWQLALYFFMIGFTFISVPKSGSTYVLYARAVQAFELTLFIVLLVTNFKQGFRLNGFNILSNSWWLLYTAITYIFTLTIVGLTPMFKWMNVMIFLLLGTCYWKENMQESMRFLTIVFSSFIYLNAILLILFPEGLWIDEEWVGRGDPTRYLFGNYNQIGFVCLLGVITQSIYTLLSRKGYFNLVCLVIVSIASVLFVGSMTSTVGLITFAGCILMRNILSKYSKTLVAVFLILYLIFYLFIIWYGKSIESIDFATRFIENALSKDTTFSNRTDIWANAVYKIKQSPWIGFGIQNVEWNDTYLGGSGPHNFWLMLLLQGGYILCFLFIFVMLYVIRTALQNINTATYSSLMGLCMLLVMSHLEAYNLIQVFLVLQFVYYSASVKEEQRSLS
jgi:O-antigen ligase